MTIEAMKQALEALEHLHRTGDTQVFDLCYAPEVIPALRTAIAEAEKQEPLAWAEEIIDDLHALYDSEMITENDSGDALIRLDAAICAVEEAEQRHTTTPPAAPLQEPMPDDLIASYEKGFKDGAAQRTEQETVAEKAIAEWAARHDIQGSPTDLRCIFEDAASLSTPPAAPVQEPMPDDLIASYEKGFREGAAQRQPLTKERIGQIIEQCKITLVNYCSDDKQTEFARAVEAAHGIR